MRPEFNSYLLSDAKPMPIRALTPNHGAVIGRDYYDLIIRKCQEYGYNEIHDANNNSVIQNLDQFIHYQAYPGLEDRITGRDRSFVEKQIELYNEFTQKANDAGLPVYVWHHEVNFPEALATLHPDGFLDTVHDFPGDSTLPVPNLDSPVIWDFIESRFEEAYAAVPGLTGVILTFQESDIPIYHLADSLEKRVEITRRLYEHINAIHKRLGKKWILRTFAWREWEYETVFRALDGFDPDVVVEMKAVPMDWSMFYPHNRLISQLQGRKKIIEMEAGGNFWEDCEMPAVSADYYSEQVRYAVEHGCDGITVRTDRQGGHTFDKPMELNIATIAAVAKASSVDVSAIEMDWLSKTYGADHAAIVKTMYDMSWEVVKRTYFINGSWAHHNRYALKLRGHCNLFVAERPWLLEPGDVSFRQEIDLAGLYVDRIESLMEELKSKLRLDIPESLPESLHYHVNPAPDPFVELARQVRNLRIRHDFFSAFKEWMYALRCQIYVHTPEAKTETRRKMDIVLALVEQFPIMATGNPNLKEEMTSLIDTIASRDIFDGAHFSQGAMFHGRSYAMPYPDPIHTTLKVNPSETNILVIFCGTHSCREVVMDVKINDRHFELRRGTMSWFWAYDGYKRGEIIIPAELCRNGTISVTISSEGCDTAPFIPEIRTEVEYDGCKPRFDP